LKLIKDPIHGDVMLGEEDLALLDSPQLQRLRRIKQIGLGDLVYPGANHTRFEHSLGTMYIAGELAERMGLQEEDRRKIRLAALLHDVGHGPFSHTSEKFAVAASQIDHSRLTERKIFSGGIAGTLESIGMDPKEIAGIATGQKTELGRMLQSQIGVDRMDYLMRDAHYTGVAYGVIDYKRIISTLVFHGGEVVIREKGIQAAESLLVARFMMYPAVYLHHVCRIADAMMVRALEELKDGGTAVEEIMDMDDTTLVTVLKQEKGIPRDVATRILNRDLFKRAVYLSPSEVGDLDQLLEMSQDRAHVRGLEDEIAGSAHLAPGSVLMDIQAKPSLDDVRIKVLSESKVELLEQRSALVRSLTEAQWDYWRFGVYCARENVQSVKEVCEGYGWRGMEK